MFGAKLIKRVLLAVVISVIAMGWRMNMAISRELMGKEVKGGLWKGEQIEYADREILFKLKQGYSAHVIYYLRLDPKRQSMMEG